MVSQMIRIGKSFLNACLLKHASGSPHLWVMSKVSIAHDVIWSLTIKIIIEIILFGAFRANTVTEFGAGTLMNISFNPIPNGIWKINFQYQTSLHLTQVPA